MSAARSRLLNALRLPEDMNQAWVEAAVGRTYGSTLLITGVPTKQTEDGEELTWGSMDDVFDDLYYHAEGLMSALGVLRRLPQYLNTANLCLLDRRVGDFPFDALKIEYRARITDWYDGSPDRENPFAWIHLGHGTDEADFLPVDDDDPYGMEVYETVPGVSNGQAPVGNISTRRLEAMIAAAKGDIMFLGLPLCYATQVADALAHCKRIRMIHAEHEGFVLESLEMYSPAPPNSPRFSLEGWMAWLWAIKAQWRPRAAAA